MTPPAKFSSELSLALHAIHTTSLLTKSVLRSLSNHVSAETKADDSPVTIADFAAQALIISFIHAVHPSDAFLGEESADALRKNDGLAEQVWQLVLRAASSSASGLSDAQHVREHDAEPMALTFPASKAEMLDLIDLGKGSASSPGRVWVMDPVDGTATFMEGQQYAVCLCLLVDGVQEVAVIGCPNLLFSIPTDDDGTTPLTLGQRMHEDTVDTDGYGVLLSAVRGQGTYVRAMHSDGLDEPRRVEHAARDAASEEELRHLNFIDSTLGKTSLSQEEHRAVAESLGAHWPGTIIWSQQLKYVALTLGATDVMLRLPKDRQRFTCTWDHAGGNLLFTETGGIVKDIKGRDIDFSQGRLIRGERNYGMVAAMPWCFYAVMATVQGVLQRRAGF